MNTLIYFLFKSFKLESFHHQIIKEISSRKTDDKTQLLYSVAGDETTTLRNEITSARADFANESEIGKSFQQLQSINSADKSSKELKAVSLAPGSCSMCSY